MTAPDPDPAAGGEAGRSWARPGARARWAVIYAVLLSQAVLVFLIPPIQAPDENSHIARAYLLTRGKLLLDTPAGSDSGGPVDEGLSRYMSHFSVFGPANKGKVTRQLLVTSAEIHWMPERAFWQIPGAGYYFPLAYLPQGLGLFIGEHTHTPVAVGFYLARLFALAATAALCLWGFRLYAGNYFVLGILALPMTLFQSATASLDGLATGATILTLSLFMRGMDRRLDFPTWMSVVLAVSTGVLVTCRTHMLPILLAPLLVHSVRRHRAQLCGFLAAGLLTVAWLAVAASSVRDTRVAHKLPLIQSALLYVHNPGTFAAILFRTLADPIRHVFYLKSFIGILGWLDVPLPNAIYPVATAALAATLMISLASASLRADYKVRLYLFLASLVSVLLIFFILLNQWTWPGASMIEGIQGRYFTVSLIVLAYALNGFTPVLGPPRVRIGAPVVALLFLVSYTTVVSTLLTRYYHP